MSARQSTDLFGPRPHDPGGRSKPRWPAGSVVSARFSDCGLYRYELFEQWDVNLPLAMFLLMNPSVACTEFADPTLIRTSTFARSWNYGGQLVGNVHAYRVTDSARLVEAADPVGPENDGSLAAMAKRADIVVLAYGRPPKPLRARANQVVSMLCNEGVRLTYLRLSKDGTPQHPLYLPGSLVPREWRAAA